MKVSLDWLGEFVDVPEGPQDLGGRLTMAGFALNAMDAAGDDTILELDVTTNRPDCLSHVGIAREIAAIYRLDGLRMPNFDVVEAQERAKDVVHIAIEEPGLCRRYCGRYLRDLRADPSPEWLQKRLEAIGIRPINSVADATNYVMMELGQPLHAFDADLLEGRRIIVRCAAREEFRTLDGMARDLDPSMLVIADESQPVALAGVIGGMETGISSRTRNILIESAWFDPSSVRRTSRGLALRTEASYRFERGADIEMARFACDRAAALIQQLAGGTICRGVIDVYPGRRSLVRTRLRRARTKGLLGMAIEDSVVEGILRRLGFQLEADGEGWSVRVPTFRVDVSSEEDLLEEVARHHGYENFPSTLPGWSGSGAGVPWEPEERSLRTTLASLGYSETYGLSLLSADANQRFETGVEPVRLRNPLSEEASVLRTSLVPTILRSVQWNVNRAIRDLQLYEMGKVYTKGGESRRLVLAACGSLRERAVHETEREFGFHDMKGDVETILDRFDTHLKLSIVSLPAHYHPKRAAAFGTTAVLGELLGELADLFKVRARVYLAEFDLETLYAKKLKPIQSTPIGRFPAVQRDLSIVLDRSAIYADVAEAIQEAGIRELVRMEPFDRREGGSFPESKYSLSISFTYQSPDRTLTDAEVDGFSQRILRLLEDRVGAQLRG